MRIEHLREFRILASTLSFTEAARKSFVSQSVLSKHISAMEKELGHKLVTRSRAGVSLTPEGEVFRAGIENTLESYSRAVHNLEEFSQRKKRAPHDWIRARCGASAPRTSVGVAEAASPPYPGRAEVSCSGRNRLGATRGAR